MVGYWNFSFLWLVEKEKRIWYPFVIQLRKVHGLNPFSRKAFPLLGSDLLFDIWRIIFAAFTMFY